MSLDTFVGIAWAAFLLSIVFALNYYARGSRNE